MPHQPTISEETEFDLPRRLPDQNAILVGRTGGLAAYYIHGRGVLLGQYRNREFMPEFTIECDRRLMSACVHAFSTADAAVELSSVGKALLQAWHFGDLTPLSHKQAHVYALREKANFGRGETASILNISPSTVDTHLHRATEKLHAAEILVKFVRIDSDELAETDPDVFDEIEASHDAHCSNDITRCP